MVTIPAAIGEQNVVQEQEAIAGFVFATDPECRHVRRAPIVPGRGTVLLALPNLELFKHLVELLESEGPNRASKICLIDANELTAIQRVHVLRELKEISHFARMVMIDPRKLTGDPSHDALALTRHLHESLETLRLALPSAFRGVEASERAGRAVHSAQQCWKLLCRLSEAVGGGHVSPGHALAVTLEALYVRLESAREALADCPGCSDFGTAFSQVYRVLTTTDAHEWSFAYDLCIEASDPAERFLMRAEAKFERSFKGHDKADQDFYRKASRAIAAFERAHGKQAAPVVDPPAPVSSGTQKAIKKNGVAKPPPPMTQVEDATRGELVAVGFDLFLSPQTRSFRFGDRWFEFKTGQTKRFLLLEFLAHKPRRWLEVNDFNVDINAIGWKRWKVGDDGLNSAVSRLKISIGQDFKVVADAIKLRYERGSTAVSFEWPPRESR